MLAIIIPFYKLTFFEVTLQSLANQTDKRFTVYIGDDASPEDCSFLLQRYEGQFDFVYHRFETNLGSISLTQQWERCINLANNEEWLMILGDDDYLSENTVEKFYKNSSVILSKNCKVIRFATVLIDEISHLKSDVFEHPRFEFGADFVMRKVKSETRSSLSEYIFKKQSYFTYGFSDYPSAFYSDDKAWFDFSEDSGIYTINDSIVYIRISSLSLSGTFKLDVLRKAEYCFYKYLFQKKLFNFSKENRIYILKRFEFLYFFNNIRAPLLFFKIYLCYLKNFDKKEFLKLNKRIAKRMFGKEL